METILFDSPGIVAADTPSSMQIKAGKYYVDEEIVFKLLKGEIIR